MDTLVQLFRDHPVVAASSAAGLVIVLILPFAGRRLPRLLLRIGSALLRAVTVPFVFWKRTVLDLASKSGRSFTNGTPSLGRRLLPVMQGLLILGGVLILTTGILTGWRASGIARKSGHTKAALRAELPRLENALRDVREKIAALDFEWEESRECRRDEALNALYAEMGEVGDENAVLRDFLSRDRQTRELYAILVGPPAGDGTAADLASDLRGAAPSLGLAPDKEWLLIRLADNIVREEEIADEIRSLSEGSLRLSHQPQAGTLLRVETELVPAIARARADIAAPDEGPVFDTAAFADASWPALVIFCGFVWAMGGLIELLGGAVTLRASARATVSEEGYLKWAE